MRDGQWTLPELAGLGVELDPHTVEQALALVRELQPRRAWFTHIAHELPHAETIARLAEAGYANVSLAYDGLQFEVRV
jgi:phosphoribosyl 1,2-cyclic phosphate phosphodiesterase